MKEHRSYRARRMVDNSVHREGIRHWRRAMVFSQPRRSGRPSLRRCSRWRKGSRTRRLHENTEEEIDIILGEEDADDKNELPADNKLLLYSTNRRTSIYFTVPPNCSTQQSSRRSTKRTVAASGRLLPGVPSTRRPAKNLAAKSST